MRHARPFLVCTALAASIAAVGSAAAAPDCSGQKGKVVYDNAFKDAGGFEQSDAAKYDASGVHITLAKGDQDFIFVNEANTAADGDFCAVATMPAPAAPENLAAVGITFLYKDDQNMFALQVFSDNTVQVERWSDGQSDFIFEEQNPAIKAAPGTPVSIRAVIANGTITPYVNGIAMKATPAKPADGANHFGLYFGLDKPAPKDMVFDFKSLHVTDGK